MKSILIFFTLISIGCMILSSCNDQKSLNVAVIETSQSGNKLTKVTDFEKVTAQVALKILPEQRFQTIEGIG
ncbi:MAG: hypothetical protein WAU01_17400, partial [Saprospiraceae bacterium]